MADPERNFVAGVLGRPFPEQVAALRLRMANLQPTARWDDLAGQDHDRAFVVAGAVKADLLADLAAAVLKTREGGGTLETFRKDFRAVVERHGWHGWTGEGTKGGEAWRTRVIWQTNMATSYAAGRHAQLVAGNYAFWVYRHGGSLEPRLQHLAWDGVALPPDHPFWASHYPPNGWGCSCRVFGARTAAGVRRVGGDPDKVLPPGWDKISPRTGAPAGIDKGWNHAPGRTVAARINEAVGVAPAPRDPVFAAADAKLPKLPAAIGAAMFHASARPRHIDDLVAAFGQFMQTALTSHVQQRHMIVGALKPAWVIAAERAGIRVESAEIAVTDRQIQHTFRGTGAVQVPGQRRPDQQPKVNPLPLDWYLQLPRHLLVPRAVLLDLTQKEPVFLLVYDVPGALAKLVVEINTPLKKSATVLNTVQSGRLISPDDFNADLLRGLKIIEGGI